MANKKLVQLTFVNDSEDIRHSLITFNNELSKNRKSAQSLLRSTSYWVFDPSSQMFGPSKFLGFKNMNFSQYAYARDGQWDGDRFDRHFSRKAIEKYLGSYEPNQELSSKLIDWGEKLFGPGIFNGLDKDKWRFVSLLGDSKNSATYLLIWNPAKWPWDNFQDDLNSISRQGYCFSTWSCGVTKKIVPDDRIFLIKLGKEEPRGLIASGWATSDVFEDEHWDEEAALAGKTALYIDVHFDTILDPEESIFPYENLEKGIYTKMNWQPQASGVTIPDNVAKQLEIDWANFVGQTLPLPEGTLPEEVDTAKTFIEGATKQIIVNTYERSAEGRSICIKYYGLSCSVCGFNFEKVYGKIGANLSMSITSSLYQKSKIIMR